ncbi:MAG: tetratricopeptide repeat protein [Phycisphaeraceae bacterium]|nr:tetratricopeptide repeat protein [Phycisphaeraceae bacterium]
MDQTRERLRSAEDLARQGRLAEARSMAAEILRAHPANADAHCLLCFILTKLGDYPAAISHIREALAHAPDDANYLSNLGKLLLLTSDKPQAEQVLRRTLSLQPASVNASIDLGHLLEGLRRYADQREALRRGLVYNPNHPLLTSNYALGAIAMGDVDHAVRVLRRCATENPDHLNVATSLASALNYAAGVPREELFAAHTRIGALSDRYVRGTLGPFSNDRTPDRRIRLGLVSPDFREHSVAHFVEPLLANLDRSDPGGFEVFCYDTLARRDSTTDRLERLADHWRDASTIGDLDLATSIRRDGVDVLVDLAGLTLGNRLPAFHVRAAPVQVTWCGYPNTTGLREMDYRIVDATTDPAGSEPWSVESLLRLDPCFLCFRPPTQAPEPASPPPDLPPTFVSFNALQKMNDHVVDLWARLLDRVPGSRLLLKNLALKDSPVREATLARFVRAGVSPDRLELIGWTDSLADHLALYSRAHVALDTFPYNGTTTTCEALWMGVPVVTLRGDRHAGRVGESLLLAAGAPAGDNPLGWLVADTEEAYLQIAADLATDRARLKSLRASLRAAMQSSPLRDEAGFAARFGAALRSAWHAWCAGTQRVLPPGPPAPSPRPAPPPSRPEISAALRDAQASINSGRFDAAKATLLRAAQRFPKEGALLNSLSGLLLHMGESGPALYYAEQGVALFPDDPGLLATLGHAFTLTGKGERAIATLRRAVALDPGLPEAAGALVELLLLSSSPASAARVCRHALDAHNGPGHRELTIAYATALLATGRPAAARARLRPIADASHADPKTMEIWASTLNYDPTATAEEKAGAHFQFGESLTNALAGIRMPPPPAPKPADAARRLRIGLLSPDFRAHAVATFIEPWLTHHDREQFEITCYSSGGAEDDVTARFKKLAARWRPATEPDHAALARRIRADGIDILFELSGLTQLNRLASIALRAAPMQISAIGYPNTTGLRQVDYRLVDSLTDPAGAELLHTERLLRLDPCFTCFRPPDSPPDVADRSAAGAVVFGCFGSMLKINDQMVRLWSRVLEATPGSRLLIKNHALSEPAMRDELAERFEMLGVGRDRLSLVPPAPGYSGHLAAYSEVDIALDTFPYNGTTTTCEASLMGVPTVTLVGDVHAARVGLTLLASLRQRDLAAASEDQYIALASALAADGPRRADLRRSLRGALLASPLCNGEAYSKRLESALRSAWAELCGSTVQPCPPHA